jgi:hypothetical protein
MSKAVGSCVAPACFRARFTKDDDWQNMYTFVRSDESEPPMTQFKLSRDQVIWSFGPELEPVLEVEPGDVVTFETNDCFTGQIQSEADLVTDIGLGRINSATGPVALKGAEPEDSLIAEILDIRPIDWGVATLIPGFGQLSHQVHAPLTRLFQVADGEIRMNDRVRFPARPRRRSGLARRRRRRFPGRRLLVNRRTRVADEHRKAEDQLAGEGDQSSRSQATLRRFMK